MSNSDQIYLTTLLLDSFKTSRVLEKKTEGVIGVTENENNLTLLGIDIVYSAIISFNKNIYEKTCIYPRDKGQL